MKYKQYIGELVPGHVVKGGEKQGFDLKVYSCRPKLNWNPYITVEFEGIFYRCFKEKHGEAPRRFVIICERNTWEFPWLSLSTKPKGELRTKGSAT
jgi:hypothetical protein